MGYRKFVISVFRLCCIVRFVPFSPKEVDLYEIHLHILASHPSFCTTIVVYSELYLKPYKGIA